MSSSLTLLRICLLFCLALSVPALAQKYPSSGKGLYKWTDENGRVHYSTSIPPEAIDNKIDAVRGGRVTKHSEAQKTPEQIAQERAEKAKQEQLQKESEMDQKRYKIIKERYSNVSEFDKEISKLNEEWDKRVLPLLEKKKRLTEDIGKTEKSGAKEQLVSLRVDFDKNEQLIGSFEKQRQTDLSRLQKDKSLWLKYSATE